MLNEMKENVLVVNKKIGNISAEFTLKKMNKKGILEHNT